LILSSPLNLNGEELQTSLSTQTAISSEQNSRRRMLQASTSVAPDGQVALFEGVNLTQPNYYNVYETFSIHIASTFTDNEPVEVDWSIKDFDG